MTQVLEEVGELPAPAPKPQTEVLAEVGELPKAGDEPLFEGLLQGLPELVVATPPTLAAGPRPASKPAAKMPPAERITIPSIGVDSKVTHLGLKLDKGVLTWETAKHAVGHHEGTSNPREGSNAVFSGHMSSPIKGEGSVFKRLPEVKVGDYVLVDTALGSFPYVVEETKLVRPADLWVMYPTASETITLITCYPDLVYTYRWVVVGRPVPFSSYYYP